MKKTLRIFGLAFICSLLVLTLASCSAQKKFEKAAEKIRVAEAKEEPLTYEKVEKMLGEPTVDATVSLGSRGKTGLVTWYAGCKTMEEVKEKVNAGKDVAYIAVTFDDGKALDAKVSVAEGKEAE